MPDTLFFSDWTVTEVSSALSSKLRTSQIGVDDRSRVLTTFDRLEVESLGLVEISARQSRAAPRLCDHHSLYLRAGDALHLAASSDHGLTLCTLDQRLEEAGPPLGIATSLIKCQAATFGPQPRLILEVANHQGGQHRH